MFRNREEAARRLANRLKGRPVHDPLVLAIPRGGVVIGAVLARELNADLDVILSRKLRSSKQPELAIGAISEDGQFYLNGYAEYEDGPSDAYLEQEINDQLAEIDRRKQLIRRIRPRASVIGRSILVTDDGIATGSTMIAALQTVNAQTPREVIVAVPVAAPDRLEEVRRWCDDAVCLICPEDFWAVGAFYADFRAVNEEQLVELLRPFAPSAREREAKLSPSRALPLSD